MEIRPVSGNEPPRSIPEAPLWEGVKNYGELLKQTLNDLNPDFSAKGELHLSAEEAKNLVAAAYKPVADAAQDPLLNKVSQVFTSVIRDTKS